MSFWNRKPIDPKPKTVTLQPAELNGDNSMANLTTINDPTHAHTITVSQGQATTVVGYPSQYAYTSQANAAYPPQYLTVTASQLPSHHQTLYPGAAIGVAPSPIWYTGVPRYYDPATDECIAAQPSRSEFTEEEIEQAERIMDELSHA